MAAGAGALELQLGGPANYQGKLKDRPYLGLGNTPQRADIERSLKLVQKGLWLWLILSLIAGMIAHA